MLNYFRDSRSLIVIHSSFTPDTPATKAMFDTLAEQPPDFVARVVIASLESNLKTVQKRQLFDAMMQEAQEKAHKRRQQLKADDALVSGVLLDPAVKLPTLPWVDDASRTLQDLKSNVLAYTPSQYPGPLLVTLPYPTSLQNAVDFSRSSHGYDGQRVRPISVLLFGLSNRRNPSAIPTRNALWHQLRQAGAVVPEGSGEETPSLMMCAEGVDCGNMQWKSLFDQTANSAFCLQPAGDTLTRSHFYLSILSGCIPVIFEPSTRSDYEDTQHTAWAWRHLEESTLGGASRTLGDEDEHDPDESQLFFTYGSFTVNVPLAQGGGIAPQPGFLQELMEMQSEDAERFAKLRGHLHKVAPLMRYSDEACDVGEPQLSSQSCVDAFSHFTRVLSRNKERLDTLHTARQKAALAQPPSDDGMGVKVYVLPVPSTLTDDLVTCYREKRGENPWDDTKPHGNCNGKRTCDECDRGNDCSEALGVETAQHASDIWLHRGLLKHSNRVKDPA